MHPPPKTTQTPQEGFFAQLVDVVVNNFGAVYPELVKHRAAIHDTIKEEEASFSKTLIKGIERFKKAAAAAKVGGLSGFCYWLLGMEGLAYVCGARLCPVVGACAMYNLCVPTPF